MEFSQQRVVVTGGGRGIGAAVAKALAAEGAAVVVAARSGAEIDATAEALRAAGHRAWAVACDVTDPAAVERLREEAESALGGVDVLINNAGIGHSAPLPAIRLEDWNRIFAVNVTGTFLCTQAFLPAMVERGWGRVINVASVAGKIGAPYISAYAASKHAVVGFTRSIAAEVAKAGVTVNAVCPGFVETEMVSEAVERITRKTGMSADEARANLERNSPQERVFAAEEVAYQVLCLCDPRAPGGQRPGSRARWRGGAIVSEATAMLPVNPEALGNPRGYSNGMLAPAGGRLLFVAGQIAWDEAQKVVPGGFAEQFSQALSNVVTVVRAAGGEPADLGSLTIFVVDRQEYVAQLAGVGAAYRELMGRHYPTMALVEVRALLEPLAKVEIQGIAVVPASSSQES